MKIFEKYAGKYGVAITTIVITVLIMFFEFFWKGTTCVVSSPHTDIAKQFIFFREFGFGELKGGNLVLWNPFLFSGSPFMGNFQSALLYPLNFVFLILPIEWSINVSVFIHVVLLGVFMCLWVRENGCGYLPAFLSGVLLMFSGAHFPHIYAGHLTNLCTMAWIPLIFLCLDKILERQLWKWVLAGMAAIAMQVLAGHPQYVYYTAIVSALYVILRLIFTPELKKTLSPLAGIFLMFFGGTLLSAIQVMTGMEASGESVRAGGVAYDFAAMFSLPPENLLTLIAPNMFGDLQFNQYWGRTYYWETNMYVGIGGLTLAVYALANGSKREHIIGILILISTVLALGARTPLFDFLYHYFPGFNQFRGTAKFIFFVDMFLSYLAGCGLNVLIEKQGAETDRRVVFLLICCSLLAAFIAGVLYLTANHVLPVGLWESFLRFIAKSKEAYIPQELYFQNWFFSLTSSFAALQFVLAAIIFLFNAVVWNIYSRRKGMSVFLILLLAVLDVSIVAGMTKASFGIREILPGGLVKFLSQVDKEKRVLNLWRPNLALTTRVGDIWGYDPGVPKRYAEFIAFTQGENPNNASQYVNFNRYHPLLKLTRLGYILVPTEKGFKVHEIKDVMPRAVLVYDWLRLDEKEQILREMSKEDFDISRTVILEREPNIERQVCKSPGKVRTEILDTDTMVVEVETVCPGIVLITDNYSKGWKARSLLFHGDRYEVLRADYTFMAIPVGSGNHRIRLEYVPTGYIVGKWISFGALVLYILLWGWYFSIRKM
ncbi:MAG: YfhO family protein [Syntrophales bacterium]|nr:YfhO family protein [Syntrophales bacterium]